MARVNCSTHQGLLMKLSVMTTITLSLSLINNNNNNNNDNNTPPDRVAQLVHRPLPGGPVPPREANAANCKEN